MAYTNFAGVDLHKKYSFITVYDRNGNKALEQQIKNDKLAIQSALSQLNNPIRVATEATFNSLWLHDILEEIGIKTIVANPNKLKAIASSKIKTDKIDSEIIARLNLIDWLPASYIPTMDERQLRDITRYRLSLVYQRTGLKNRISAFLLRNCILDCPYSDKFGVGGQKWLTSLELKHHEKELIKDFLDLINAFNSKVSKLNSIIRERIKDEPNAQLLDSIPGVGSVIAATLSCEIGNIHRFSSPKQLTAFAGLVPSTYSSGGKTTHGQITKTGNQFIRHALSEAIEHTIKKDTNLKSFFERLKEKKGRSKAKIACMRKLLTYIYFMLKEEIPFSELAVNKNRTNTSNDRNPR
jgi:transposase